MSSAMSAAVAVTFALASALVIAWGTVARHRIVLGAGETGGVLATAVRSPMWWLGAFAAVAAYLLQLGALSFGSVLIVQPILVLSLLFTLIVAAVWERERVDRVDSVFALVLGMSVAVLVLVGRPLPGHQDLALTDWAPWLIGGAVALGTLIAAAYRRPHTKAFLLGTATGLIYGYVAPVAKTTVDAVHTLGVGRTLASWEPWLLITLIAAGSILQQYSFSAGPLEQSLPAMTVAEPIIAMTVSYVVLGETFSIHSTTEWALMVLALVGMIGGTVALSARTAEN